MTKAEILLKAQSGETEAILQLIECLAEERNWTEAIDWADKAADTYDPNGLYKAAVLHHLRLSSLIQGNAPMHHLMEEDAQAVQKYTDVLLAAGQAGLIELPTENTASLLKLRADACYDEALVCHVKENPDEDRVLNLLREAEGTKEMILFGLACYHTQLEERAREVLEKAYRDSAYAAADKAPAEQYIYAEAALTLAGLLRLNGQQMDQAVAVLNQGIRGVTGGQMKEALQIELAHYQKKLFGGWKYI